MRKFFLMISVFLGLMAFGLPAQATTLTFGLDTEFGGPTPPVGATPWITAIFDDSFGNANTVRLTVSADNLSGVEYINVWLFNFNPVLDPTELDFSPFDITDSTPIISTGVNAYGADGDGYFDIQFNFPQPEGSGRFTAGETVVYDITYDSAIDVSAFNFFETGGEKGTFYSAAHIGGIAPNGDKSGWIAAPAPVPPTTLLFGCGLIGLAVVGRKKIQ